jgi:hypothetical protein
MSQGLHINVNSDIINVLIGQGSWKVDDHKLVQVLGSQVGESQCLSICEMINSSLLRDLNTVFARQVAVSDLKEVKCF